MSNEHIQRLKYFKGQLLTAKDFEDQQNYHREKLDRFIERFPHGIVRGLNVICSAADSRNLEDFDAFLIQEGLAIDDNGNVIIVLEQGVRTKISDYKESSPYLGLVYDEDEICIQQGCDSPAKKNRVLEKVKVDWSTLPNTPNPGKHDSIITVAKIEPKSSATIDETSLIADKVCTNHLILDKDESGPVIRLDAGLITKDQIVEGAITSNKIATWSPDTDEETGVKEEHIQDGAVTTDKIRDGAVNSVKLDSAVQATPKDNSVTEAKIADDAVTTDKIQDGAVNSDKLDSAVQATPKDNSVTEAKIADGAVTTDKIQDGAVNSDKLDSAVQATPKDNSVTEAKITDNAVTMDKIQNLAVTSEKLALTKETIGADASGSLGPFDPALPIYGFHDIDTQTDELLSFQVIPTAEGGPLFWTVGINKTPTGALKYRVRVENRGTSLVDYIVYKIRMGTSVP